MEPRRRAEQALTQVICQCYVEGVSTRRVDDIVKTLGIDGISESQMSNLAASLDPTVEAFRTRPLDAGPYTYVWVDGLTMKVREGGRIVNVVVVVATGVNANRNREVLGLDVVTSEDGAGWLAFLRSLVARGLTGVQPVISDCHEGLRHAIAAVLPGASWQRCRTHFMRNLLTKVPKASQSMVATLVRTIFEQPDAEQVWAQHARVVEQLHPRFPDAAAMLVDAAGDILAFAAFPVEHWSAIRSNNPQERQNKRTPSPHRRRWHLPQPSSDRAARRRRARRTARRVGRRPPLHERRQPQPRPAPNHPQRHTTTTRGGEHARTHTSRVELQPKVDAVVIRHHVPGLDLSTDGFHADLTRARVGIDTGRLRALPSKISSKFLGATAWNRMPLDGRRLGRNRTSDH